ncbi:MAG TPA: DNA-formamidopyrimidine glycosylase [Acidimicrobiaceae bacterium]|nr:DNA-formamidopyrimidine glycosylase [Acidimicrobiaceae bacterium]
MPELPEVETIRRQLRGEIIGQMVLRAGSHQSEKFLPARKTKGRRFIELARRGKYLIGEFDDETELIIHLGMTGQLLVDREAEFAKNHDQYCRAWWSLTDDKTVVFRDVRRFGRIAVVGKGDYSKIPTLRDMGPEPFSVGLTGNDVWHRTRGRRSRIKTQLLSQRLIAGVGNIYADEALFLAQINPAVRSISRCQAQRLLDSVRTVFSEAIERGGTTLRDYRNLEGEGSNQHHLKCYGRAGESCVVCGSTLRLRVIDARSTTWCPQCQAR